MQRRRGEENAERSRTPPEHAWRSQRHPAGAKRTCIGQRRLPNLKREVGMDPAAQAFPGPSLGKHATCRGGKLRPPAGNLRCPTSRCTSSECGCSLSLGSSPTAGTFEDGVRRHGSRACAGYHGRFFYTLQGEYIQDYFVLYRFMNGERRTGRRLLRAAGQAGSTENYRRFSRQQP